ncbi:glyoxylate/hydroxypyruvate reductase A [Rhodoferax lacus]|uniref:Glyoxylate/hydroxypyruvate reductase A n=1 Tax=Rhodoferax lacus TaxID=2184758 RepID=A0A3E1RA60_9BURK|nr:glyoxylate/hydroxypyruvate reductase A [Rhodoferax lacus]RFO96153.1 glyoxylate/hydroxypyruvate reductase A [Rhodoferax lacus]
MHITFCCAATDAEPWLQDLRGALPGADISLWQPGAAPADYGIVWQPPQAFFDQQPQLRAAFNIGAGVDALLRLNIAPATVLVRLDDAGMAVQMAEYVCHALIRHYREFAGYAADQQAATWQQREIAPRSAMPVGIMGLGVLGARVAQAVAQFGFPVNGWSRTPKTIPGVRCYSGAGGFHEFLAATRVLVSVLPATPQTRDLINRDTLSRLQSGAYLINVARGAHLVEDDLLALLESGHMAGATLDVFRTEPLPVAHPFWTHPRVTVTPHTAALTVRGESIAQIVGKIQAMQRGEAVRGLVDRQRGY